MSRSATYKILGGSVRVVFEGSKIWYSADDISKAIGNDNTPKFSDLKHVGDGWAGVEITGVYAALDNLKSEGNFKARSVLSQLPTFIDQKGVRHNSAGQKRIFKNAPMSAAAQRRFEHPTITNADRRQIALYSPEAFPDEGE